MPPVRAVLEARLDAEREPTLTTRSVYGRHLTSLAGFYTSLEQTRESDSS